MTGDLSVSGSQRIIKSVDLLHQLMVLQFAHFIACQLSLLPFL